MSIQNLISEDIKKAMLAREVDKLAALRSVKSAILLEASKDGSSEISDDIALKIIIKLVKQRKDSAQIYKEQNRPDLESDELKQLKYLEFYLPEQLSNDEIETKWIDASDLGKKYFVDLSIDCQNLVIDLFKHEPLDLDENCQ